MKLAKKEIKDFLNRCQKYIKTDIIYLIKGGFWWIVGKLGVSLISFITLIFFANWLSKENYGTYQFILASLGLFSIFTLPGIDVTIIKSITQKKEGTLELALKEKIKWGSVGSLLSLIFAVWYFLQGNNFLAIVFLLGSLLIPFYSSFFIFNVFWWAKKRFDLHAKYQIICAGLSALLVILVVFLTANIFLIISVFLISQVFIGWFFYQKTKQQIISNEKDESAISFGKHLTLMNVFHTIAYHFDKIIIWKFLGAVPLAIYTFAISPIQKLQEMSPLIPLSLPKLGELKIDKERKKNIISKFLWLFIITVPGTIILILIAPFLYQLFFPQYMESVIYFQVLSIIIALSPFGLLSVGLVTEMKKRALYLISIFLPLFKIILFFILLPFFGIWGIIITLLITEFLGGLLVLYFFLKI